MAESPDSIDFLARYKDWNVGRSITISDSTNTKDIAAYLAGVREEADNKAFEILGIKRDILESYSDKVVKGVPKGGYSNMVTIYKSLGSAETEEAVNRASDSKEELKPFAKAYILRSAMLRLGISFYLARDAKALSGNTLSKVQKDGKSPFQSDGISFMAKYKTWISIKKMSITTDTKPEEVSAHLASVRLATDRKSMEILGVNVDNLDMYAMTVTGTMRKSAANLEKMAAAITSPAAMKEVETACNGNAALKDAAQSYLFSVMLKNLKIDYYVSTDTLRSMYPGLKIPKPKGRMPGQKKKKQ